MMKDRMQKINLVKYFLKRRWYPQMEVVILSDQTLSSSSKQVTDIDVLGLFPSANGKLKEILGDCKTLKNQSPINRILWLKGLLELTDSESGIIILSKKIEKDHKLIADKLNISIMHETEFNRFSSVTTSQLDQFKSAIEKVELWEKKVDLKKQYPQLSPLIDYTSIGVWNEKSAGTKIRKIISSCLRLKNEFNPDKDVQVHLLLDAISIFSISLNELVCTIFNQSLSPNNKSELENDLKLLIWDGRETYEYMNQIRKKLPTGHNADISDLSLPEWSKFLELIRACLDEPYSTNRVPLILKEISFEYLEDKSIRDSFNFSKQLLNETPQAGRFSIQIIDYFCSATKIPPEFKDILIKRLMLLQR